MTTRRRRTGAHLSLLLLGLWSCSSNGAGPGAPPVVTKVVVINSAGTAESLQVLANRGYILPNGTFLYRPNTLLAPRDSIVVRYNFDTVDTALDTVVYLQFLSPPHRQQVVVNTMVYDSRGKIPEPADTVIRIALNDSAMSVMQPACTDVGYDGIAGLTCKHVTLVIRDKTAGAFAAVFSPDGHIFLVRDACFSGWTVNGVPGDSVAVDNYDNAIDARTGVGAYQTFWVNGQQGSALSEQLDSLSTTAQGYWTITHTGTCP